MVLIKTHQKLFVWLLIFLLTFGSIPPTGVKAQIKTPKKSEVVTTETTPAPEINQKVGEIVENRTEDTKTFYNGNGTYTKKLYFEPIHKKNNETKKFEEISTSLIDNDTDPDEIEAKNTIIEPTFYKKIKKGKYASFKLNGNKIEYGLLEASGTEQAPIEPANVKTIKEENKIIHKQVYPGVDMQNIVFGDNIKEDLVLSQYTGLHIFKFKLHTSLKAQQQDDGTILFKDKEGNRVFELPKPFMSDSNYDEHLGETQKSDNVTYQLDEADDGYTLTVNADSEWLKDPERVYPVYIDPTTSITSSSDTFVMSKYPTTNYSSASSKWDAGQGQYVLKTGYYDATTGTNYAFLKHSITDFNNMNVTSATFNTYVTHTYSATAATGLWLDSVDANWSPTTVTWDTKPTSTNIGKVDVTRDSWAKFDVTSVAKAWADGTRKNYGFKLHTNGNGQGFWKKIVSTTNSTLKPYLSVTYTIPKAETPTGNVFSNGDDTGYANLSWPAVKGATGYKVWVFNGSSYQDYSVGNVTSWSTKGKSIWPTSAEIGAGKYTLHTDGKGSELAIDPSPVYRNSGGTYPTKKNYWFRVSAEFTQGEGATSAAYAPTLPDLKLPEAPTGASYSNGNGTGYLDVHWKPVTGATGYKVLLFNGKSYESLDVGNVTEWTTKGKKYWPTNAEIKTGSYKPHLTDNTGAELAVDPSSVYANAGPTYATRTNYFVRVVAYNSQGETVNSPQYTPSITDINKPTVPTGAAYTNILSSNSGYIMLNWDEIAGATGYKVWLYNGKDYQEFDVGKETAWTTQNKGIWPTTTEIAAGKYQLHTDGKGTELAVDPSPVYKNSGGSYAASKNYWLRISAYNAKGETVYSNPFRPTFGEPVEFLGEEDYWSILDVPYGKANMATGNLIISEDDVSISGRGPELGVSRTYNSLSNSAGIFGFGWHSDTEMTVTSSSDKTKATFIDDDATVHTFTKQASGSYKAPTGVYLELEEQLDAFVLTTKDQTKAHFDKTTGRLTKMVDGYDNTLSYTYDTSGKLISMKDASDRTLKFSYNPDNYVQSITDPENRKITYEYTDGFLSETTQTAGEVTTYTYEDGKLAKVTEPNNTTEKPVTNQFVYDKTNDHVKEIINPNNQKYLLDYDLANKTLLFTQPNGRKLQYMYNAAANPVQEIEDVDGLNLTSTFKYEGNNLIETKDPNDLAATTPTESYKYDSNGNVISATDSYGTETYEYNKNNDVTSVVDTEGDKTTVAYDDLDAVSETDQTGKSSSVAKYQKNTAGNSNGNLIESSYDLGTGTNLLQNNSFESGLTGWTVKASNNSGTTLSDTTTGTYLGLSGSKSVKVTTAPSVSTLSYVAATQEVPMDANGYYTLSGRIKTNLSKANAFYNVRFLSATNTGLGWADNRYAQMTGKQSWKERQFSFKAPVGTAKAIIYLEVDQKNATAVGEAWFDTVQLEKAEGSSSYNPVINSSFNDGLTEWTGTGGSIDNTEGFEDDSSLKVTRSSVTSPGGIYKQAIHIGQSMAEKPFDMTLTGLSKADNVKKGTGAVADQDYSLMGKVFYADGTMKDYVAGFPTGTQEWNRAAVKIPAEKPIEKIEVLPVFKGNYTGTVWFNGIRLINGLVTTKNTYDANQNYVTETEDELGYTTKSTYDTYGNKLTDTDAKGETNTYQYDAANQLKKLLLQTGTSLNYQYDKNGNMTSKQIMTAGGSTQNYTYVYDASGKPVETVGPLNEKTTNTYDANNNLLTTLLPNGNRIAYTYDGTYRKSGESFNEVQTYGYAYDKNGNELSVDYKKENRTKTRTYDKSDRVTEQNDRSASQKWTYTTASDKLNEFLFTHGTYTQKLTYQYNKLDQNTVVNDGDASYRFDYDERGNVKTFITGNGAGTSFTYDDRGLVSQLFIGSKDGNDLLEESYSYDANGNRTKISTPDGQTTEYVYGQLDQLEKETLPDGTTLSYGYDGFGNRTSVTKTKGTKTTTTASDYNNANQLTKFGSEVISYDANGNRTADGKYLYKWNAQDQLVSITKQGETTPFVTYQYDEDGRRIQKDLGGQVTNYFYDGDSLNVLYETDGQNQVVRSYIYSEAGQLMAMKKGADKYYYHYNAHGDVIAMSDKEGNTVASYAYDAWGNVLKAEEDPAVKDNPYRYAGYQYDAETGMYYLIARYYNPEHGVFLSLDPDPGDEDDILTQNGYSYANNNPVMFVDPDGHWVWLAVNAGFAAYDGYKAYKAGKNKKQIAWAVASGFGPGRYLKGAKRVLRLSAGRKGAQQRLKSLISDTKQPKHIRGWIKNEMRHIRNKKRRNIRVPRGYELAHRRGNEARKGASYEHSDPQVIRNHRLQHFHDGYGKGRKNKNNRWKFRKN